MFYAVVSRVGPEGGGLKVKVCGLKTADDVRAAVDLGFDYLGFVLQPGRQRSLSLSAASKLAELAQRRGPVVTVAVAVELRAEWCPGLEGDPLHAFSLLQFYRYPRWPWPPERRLRVVENAAECAHAALYLFDQSQGSGNWAPPPPWLSGREVLFAGGVRLEHLERLRELRIYGVDVSTGLEVDGRKNYEMMRRFREALR